jgi:maltose O-acetyltransferase
MSLRQTLANTLMGFLPATRAYRAKAWLMRQAGVKIASSCRLTSSVKILGTTHIEIGEDTFVGHEVLITGGTSRIVIGSNVDIAPRVMILAGSHRIDMIGRHSAGEACSLDIQIEDGVWLGAGATILGGVTIGRKAVIAAGSVVTEDIPPYTVAAGVPCQPRKRWSQDSESWIPLRQSRAA